jgi:hypothetical protein
MAKDRRYKTVKALIESGQLKNFREVYDIIPKSVIGADLKINYYKSTKRFDNPGTFEVDEIIGLAKLIEVDDVVIYQLLAKTRKG